MIFLSKKALAKPYARAFGKYLQFSQKTFKIKNTSQPIVLDDNRAIGIRFVTPLGRKIKGLFLFFLKLIKKTE